jgi:hypothetical protein
MSQVRVLSPLLVVLLRRDAPAYEERWEQRELGYRVSFFAFGAATAVLGVASRRRRR